MEKINGRQLIDLVAEDAHLSKRDTKAVIDSLINLITSTLENGGEVGLANFGSFSAKVKADRIGTDPTTHERITIKGKNTVTFKAAKAFKETLNK